MPPEALRLVVKDLVAQARASGSGRLDVAAYDKVQATVNGLNLSGTQKAEVAQYLLKLESVDLFTPDAVTKLHAFVRGLEGAAGALPPKTGTTGVTVGGAPPATVRLPPM